MFDWKFQNFKREEFICRCGCDILDLYEENYFYQVLYFWQPLRYDIKNPIHITSAIRCKPHNKIVGGSNHSYHTVQPSVFPYSPTATDFKVFHLPKGFVTKEISKHIDLNYCGYKMYEDFEGYCRGHIDFRNYKARW